MEERCPLRRQPEDHNFGSLMMLAVTAGAVLLVTWVATKGLFFFLTGVSNPVKAKVMAFSRAYAPTSRQPPTSKQRCGCGCAASFCPVMLVA